MNKDLCLKAGFEENSVEIPTDKNILENVIKPKKLNPQQRLQKLVKAHITKIEKQMANGQLPAPYPYFKASVVLDILCQRLDKTLVNIKDKHSRHSVLAQIISNEMSKINECTNGGCIHGAAKIYTQLKTNGTTFVAPVRSNSIPQAA